MWPWLLRLFLSSSLHPFLSVLSLFLPSHPHPCSFNPPLPSCLYVPTFLHFSPSQFPSFISPTADSILDYFTMFLQPFMSYLMAPLFLSQSATSCHSTLFTVSHSFYVILISIFLISHPPPPPHHTTSYCTYLPLFPTYCKPFYISLILVISCF